MTVQYKIHTGYKPPAPRVTHVKAGASNFISISMLADGKAPPASSYYGIIGKSESKSVATGAEGRCAIVKKKTFFFLMLLPQYLPLMYFY